MEHCIECGSCEVRYCDHCEEPYCERCLTTEREDGFLVKAECSDCLSTLITRKLSNPALFAALKEIA